MRVFSAVFCVWTFLCGQSFAGNGNDEVNFRQLAENVWLHTSYRDFPGLDPFPSNGLIISTENQVLLIDSAWNNDQTTEIINWTVENLGAPISHAVFTHAHADKMGGVGVLQEYGISTYAHELSNAIAPNKGLVPAGQSLRFESENPLTTLEGIEIFYPGPGHTTDNIVVYIPQHKILFGGCLIRPGGTSSLGNTADADIENWDDAVAGVAAQFPDAASVIPSHGPPADRTLFEMTISLAQDQIASTD